MKRIPFSQVLNNASIDIRREYDRLYSLFCCQKLLDGMGNSYTLRDLCAVNFINLPFRGTCISLDDFDDFYDYHFEKNPSGFNLDYLISFCEYSYNLAIYNQGINYGIPLTMQTPPMQLYVQQVIKVIESLGYMMNSRKRITDFVPKDQAAISVSEIAGPELSYRIIEYNHHSMKGNIERKKAILTLLADKLEPKRERLKQINASLESDLFFLLNNLNIRHNNTSPEGKNYIQFVADMKESEAEQWYDEIYQMCLLAFLELDHIERKKRVKNIKLAINKMNN